MSARTREQLEHYAAGVGGRGVDMDPTVPPRGTKDWVHGVYIGPARPRGIRVDDATWDAAIRRARLEHRSLADVVRIALRAYVDGSYDAIEPPRKVE